MTFSYAQQAIQYNIVSYMLEADFGGRAGRGTSEILRRSWIGNLKSLIPKKWFQERMEKSEFLFPLLLDGYQSNPSEEGGLEELRQAAVSCGLIGDGDAEMYRFVVLVTNISDGDQDRTNRASVQAIDTILKNMSVMPAALCVEE